MFMVLRQKVAIVYRKAWRQAHVVDARLPNARYGGSAVRNTGEHTLTTYLKNRHRASLSSVDDETVEEFIRAYDMDSHTYSPPYEPTTLVALAAVARIARAHPGDRILALGTGHNAPLYPPKKTYSKPFATFRNQQ